MTRRTRSGKRLRSAGLATTLALSLLSVGSTAFAASPPTVGLGTSAAFAILAGTPDIANTGPSTITGDLGIHPAVAVSGFPPGTVNGTIHAGDAVALQAKSDLVIAYDDAAGRPVTSVVAAGQLGGQTLVGGVYNAGGVSLNLTGTLTLNAENDPNAVWIFQATSDLITASSSTVTFINGGNPCNVFWQVTSSATLGSGSTFVGTILALTSITMATGVSMQGRALARNGNVTLINDSITRPTCATTAPGAPSNLTATAGNGQVALTWSAPASNGGSPITVYKLYRGTVAGGETDTGITVTGTSYTNTGLTNGTTYYFKVSAVNAVGEGGLSNEASATPIAPAPTTPPTETLASATAPTSGTGMVVVVIAFLVASLVVVGYWAGGAIRRR